MKLHKRKWPGVTKQIKQRRLALPAVPRTALLRESKPLGNKDTRVLVARWWRERMLAGRMFANPEAAQKGYDYLGNDEWPTWVWVGALWADFASDKGVQLPKSAFVHYFTRAAGDFERHNIQVKWTSASGVVLRRRHRTMYHIGKPRG